MCTDAEIINVVNHAKRHLSLKNAYLSESYSYCSLPLCVLDAVFSIGVRYEAVIKVVARYCQYTKQKRIRSFPNELLPQSEQESITSFCSRPEQADTARMAETVYQNRQRTSTRKGILKSEAALRFAKVLQRFGVEYMQDVVKVASNCDFEREIRAIPGQTTGISLKYFWMLAGSDEFIKPDRMIQRFLEAAIHRTPSDKDALVLLRGVSQILSIEYPNVTPRLLDHEIWKYQRTG